MPKNKFLYTILFILFNYMMLHNVNGEGISKAEVDKQQTLAIVASHQDKLSKVQDKLSLHLKYNKAFVLVLDPSSSDQHGGEGFAARVLLNSILTKDIIGYSQIDLSGGQRATQIAKEFIAGAEKFKEQIEQSDNIIILLFHGTNPSPSTKIDLERSFKYSEKSGYQEKNLYMINGNGPVLLNLTYENYAKFISELIQYLNKTFYGKNISIFTPGCGINNLESVFYPAKNERNLREETLIQKVVAKVSQDLEKTIEPRNSFSFFALPGAKTYTTHPGDVEFFNAKEQKQKSDLKNLAQEVINRLFYSVENIVQGVHLSSTTCREFGGFVQKSTIEKIATGEIKAFINPRYYKEISEAFEQDITLSRTGNSSIKLSTGKLSVFSVIESNKIETKAQYTEEEKEIQKKEIQSPHSSTFIAKFSK